MAPTRPRLLFALSYRSVRFRPVMRFTQNHKAFVRETQLSELSFARESRLAVDQSMIANKRLTEIPQILTNHLVAEPWWHYLRIIAHYS
jgi:hypothetical protein